MKLIQSTPVEIDRKSALISEPTEQITMSSFTNNEVCLLLTRNCACCNGTLFQTGERIVQYIWNNFQRIIAASQNTDVVAATGVASDVLAIVKETFFTDGAILR